MDKIIEKCGSTSLPSIWYNMERKTIVLTNRRVGTNTIDNCCKDKNYCSIKHGEHINEHEGSDQYFLVKFIESLGSDFENWFMCIFVINPYKRMTSIFPGMMAYTTNDNIMNVNLLKSWMTPEELNTFNLHRYTKNVTKYHLCLDIFLKYFNRYYEYNTNCDDLTNIRFDGHITPQTHPMIYDISILKQCTVIKFEELTSDINKQHLMKLFDANKLNKCHPTHYYVDKNQLLTEEYIRLINKYYENDFILFNYEII